MTLCERAFGIPPQQVARGIESTLEEYGGWNLQVTKVLSVTGAVDPWSELSMQKTADTAERPVYRVPGASHHFWTHAVRETDAEPIQQAREIIINTLRGWLDESLPAAHRGGSGSNANDHTLLDGLGSPPSLFLRRRQGSNESAGNSHVAEVE